MEMTRWLKKQLYFNIILSIIISFKYQDAWIISGILIVTLLVVNKRLFQLLGIIVFPVVFVQQFSIGANMLIKVFPGSTNFIYIFYVLGMLILIIPLAKEIYGAIRNPIFQLVASIWLAISVLGTGSPNLSNIDQDSFLYGLNNSHLLNGLIIFVYAYFVIESWGYRFQLNLPFDFSKNSNIIFLFLVIAIALWISFLSVFTYTARTWNTVFWNWDFSVINPLDSDRLKNVWEILLQSLRAGIAEESERYINILLILTILKNKKLQIEWAILGSSLIFALSHFLNLYSVPPYQMTLNQVVHQVINAFGLGCFLQFYFFTAEGYG